MPPTSNITQLVCDTTGSIFLLCVRIYVNQRNLLFISSGFKEYGHKIVILRQVFETKAQGKILISLFRSKKMHTAEILHYWWR